jgi:hypothetical protein
MGSAKSSLGIFPNGYGYGCLSGSLLSRLSGDNGDSLNAAAHECRYCLGGRQGVYVGPSLVRTKQVSSFASANSVVGLSCKTC